MNTLLLGIKASPVATFLFVITLVTSLRAFQDELLKQQFLLHPHSMFRRKKYYQLVTSGLIHGNWMHLLFNMVTFYFFCFQLERYIVLIDVFAAGETTKGILWFAHIKFFLVYFVSLVLSDLFTAFKYRNDPTYKALGASGALSGIVLFAIMIMPPMSIYGIIPGWLFGIGFVMYSYIAARRSRDNIGHEAHLFGALTGVLMALIMYPDSASTLLQRIGDSF